MQRRRSGRSTSLKDRLASFAKKIRKQASLLPPGEEKESLLEKAKQATDPGTVLGGREL